MDIQRAGFRGLGALGSAARAGRHFNRRDGARDILIGGSVQGFRKQRQRGTMILHEYPQRGSSVAQRSRLETMPRTRGAIHEFGNGRWRVRLLRKLQYAGGGGRGERRR